MNSHQTIRKNSQSGFTLVEMIVSVGLFAIVSVVCISALLSLVAADRKAQAIQTSMNNLNLAIDDLVRNARMGTAFDGSVKCSSNNLGAKDCSGGASVFSFACNSQMSGCVSGQRWVFAWDQDGRTCGQINSICESTNGGTTWLPITSSDVTITNLVFYVIGTTPGCDQGSPGSGCVPLQPRVIIDIQGNAGTAGSNSSTTFHLEANAVQRVLDL